MPLSKTNIAVVFLVGFVNYLEWAVVLTSIYPYIRSVSTHHFDVKNVIISRSRYCYINTFVHGYLRCKSDQCFSPNSTKSLGFYLIKYSYFLVCKSRDKSNYKGV